MSGAVPCESAAMDAVVFSGWKDATEPCAGPGTVPVRGYQLCVGCAAALEVLGTFGRSGLRERAAKAREQRGGSP